MGSGTRVTCLPLKLEVERAAPPASPPYQAGKRQVRLPAHRPRSPRRGCSARARERPLRVALLDDQPEFRDSLVLLLEQARMEVVVQAGDAPGFLAQVEEQRPDVAIIDLDLGAPGRRSTLEGLEVLVALTSRHPRVHCLVLSSCQAAQVVKRCLAAGARGYLSKLEVGIGSTLAALEALRRGERVVCPESLLGEEALAQALREAGTPGSARRG